MKKTNLNIYIGLIAITVIILAGFNILTWNSKGVFSVGVFRLLLRNVFLYMAIAIIILRIFFTTIQSSMLYLTVAIVNLLLMPDALLSLLLPHGSPQWLYVCLLNALTGVAIIIDYSVGKAKAK